MLPADTTMDPERRDNNKAKGVKESICKERVLAWGGLKKGGRSIREGR